MKSLLVGSHRIYLFTDRVFLSKNGFIQGSNSLGAEGFKKACDRLESWYRDHEQRDWIADASFVSFILYGRKQ
jgi:hypothetical protein